MANDTTRLEPAQNLARKAKTPFPGQTEGYREAREALLAEEIELRRHLTRVTGARERYVTD